MQVIELLLLIFYMSIFKYSYNYNYNHNYKYRIYYCLILFCFSYPFFTFSQSIEEKKNSVVTSSTDFDPETHEALKSINQALKLHDETLKELYKKAQEIYEESGLTSNSLTTQGSKSTQNSQNSHKKPSKEFLELLEKIKHTKEKIKALEKKWRLHAVQESGEEYALWYQPETTIGQLVMDYGSHEYVYLIPEEINQLPINVNSNFPIPSAIWQETLSLILAQNGIGVKQLNSYVRQLYFLEKESAGLKHITNNRQDLESFSGMERVAFVLTPQSTDARGTVAFLQKFIEANQTVVQVYGTEIWIVGYVASIKELLTLYDFTENTRGHTGHKLVTLHKIEAEDMAKILGAIFPQESGKKIFQITQQNLKEKPLGSSSGLKIISMPKISHALFLVGTESEIMKAEEIIKEVEESIIGVQGKSVFWYRVRYSNAEELAEVLQRLYSAMTENAITSINGNGANDLGKERPSSSFSPSLPSGYESPQFPYGEPYSQSPTSPELGVRPSSIGSSTKKKEGGGSKHTNFIVDKKTGTIAMVIESYYYPKFKEVLAKLDVPKQMVQIDVLLFEKQLVDINQYGLNLLNMGSEASGGNSTGAGWAGPTDTGNGIFNFILKRPKTGDFTAYDLTYRFLMTQEDLQVKASPTVMTVNQTATKLTIVDEISIAKGVTRYSDNTSTENLDRAQYGITLELTPTVHLNTDSYGEIPDFVTLETKVNFDTPQNINNQNTPVVRREIVNEVRVADGETIILAGLHREAIKDSKDSVPFLGEIPGLGKLFSFTKMRDDKTEMFMFLTPHIVRDNEQKQDQMRLERLNYRPGDLEDYMNRLYDAKETVKRDYFENSMKQLLGR